MVDIYILGLLTVDGYQEEKLESPCIVSIGFHKQTQNLESPCLACCT